MAVSRGSREGVDTTRQIIAPLAGVAERKTVWALAFVLAFIWTLRDEKLAESSHKASAFS